MNLPRPLPPLTPERQELVTKHSRLVYSAAHDLARGCRCRNQIDDMISDGLYALCRLAADHDYSVPFSARVSKIVPLRIIDGLRKRRNLRRGRKHYNPVPLPDQDWQGPDLDPADVAEWRDTVEHLESKMTLAERRVLRQHFVDGQSMRGIAEEMGFSEAWVFMLRKAALRRLRRVRACVE